jgi:hypothetical protein
MGRRLLATTTAWPRSTENGSMKILYAFDLIELNGDDLRRDPLEVRKGHACIYRGQGQPGIRFNEHVEGDGPTVFAHACRAMCASCGWLRRLTNTLYHPEARRP